MAPSLCLSLLLILTLLLSPILGEEDVRFFAWGEGGNGRLGLDTDKARSTPRETLPSEVVGDVAKIVGSEFHNVLLTSQGHLYSWGGGGGGQLGHYDSSDHRRPKLLEAVDTKVFVDVDVGWGHTIACTDTGDVFTWGFDKYGQLGHGERTTEYAPRLVEALHGTHVVHVAAGTQHSIALTIEGDVITWGHGGYGQLGHGEEENEAFPRKVMALDGIRVVQVSGGDRHTIVRTSKGEVYVWGGGNCAMNYGIENTLTPTLVTPLKGHAVTFIGSGVFHCLAATATNLYTWGWGHYGQLGHGGTRDERLPRPIKDLHKKEIVETYGGFGHSLARTASGEVYTWGGGKDSLLLDPKDPPEKKSVPRLVPGLQDKKISHIAVGFYHNIAVLAPCTAHCYGHGTCVNGRCKCFAGFTGEDCGILDDVESLLRGSIV